MGDMAVQNLAMAVATTARNVDTGIIGIGFDVDDSCQRALRRTPTLLTTWWIKV